MAVNVADLNARISLDTAGLEAGAEKAVAATKKLGLSFDLLSEQLNKLAQTAPKSVDQLGRIAGDAANVLNRFGSEFKTAMQGLRFTEAASKAAADIQKLDTAMKSGLITADQFKNASRAITQELQRFGGAGTIIERFGTQLQQLTMAGIQPIAAISPTAGRALTGLVGTLGATGLALTGIGAAAALGGGALVSLGASAARTVDDMGDLAARTGISVESLSSLAPMAARSRVSVEELSLGLSRMQNKLVEAATSGGPAADAIQALGLNASELLRLKPDEAFERLSMAISSIPSPAGQTAAAMDIFGRTASRLVPVMKELAETSLPGVLEAAKRTGAQMSGESVQAAAKWEAAMSDLSQSSAALGRSMGTAIVPALTEIIGLMARGVEGLNSFKNAMMGVDSQKTFLNASIAAFEHFLSFVPGASGAFKQFIQDLESAKAAEKAFAEQRAGGRGGFGAPTPGPLPPQVVAAQMASIEQLRQAATDAATQRANAEDAAQGRILSILNRTKDQTIVNEVAITNAKAAQLKQQLGDGEQYNQARILAQQALADKIIAIETETAEKRKAILAAASADALAGISRLEQANAPTDQTSKRIRDILLESFGPAALGGQQPLKPVLQGMQDLLKLSQEIKSVQALKDFVPPEQTERLRQYDELLGQLTEEAEKVAKAAGLSKGEFDKAFGDTTAIDNLKTKLVDVNTAQDQFKISIGETGDAAVISTGKINAYADAMDRAAKSAAAASLELTGKSLDTSVEKVGQAIEANLMPMGSMVTVLGQIQDEAAMGGQALQTVQLPDMKAGPAPEVLTAAVAAQQELNSGLEENQRAARAGLASNAAYTEGLKQITSEAAGTSDELVGHSLSTAFAGAGEAAGNSLANLDAYIARLNQISASARGAEAATRAGLGGAGDVGALNSSTGGVPLGGGEAFGVQAGGEMHGGVGGVFARNARELMEIIATQGRFFQTGFGGLIDLMPELEKLLQQEHAAFALQRQLNAWMERIIRRWTPKARGMSLAKLPTLPEDQQSSSQQQGFMPQAFAAGGTVPGPMGEPVLIMAHAGERVTSVSESNAEDHDARPSLTIVLQGPTVMDERTMYNFAGIVGQQLADHSRRAG